jgi:hypothetical protein
LRAGVVDVCTWVGGEESLEDGRVEREVISREEICAGDGGVMLNGVVAVV